jgi:hypothetical protein
MRNDGCGKTMGHGEFCCAGHLCDQCRKIDNDEKTLRQIDYHIATIAWHTMAMKAHTEGMPEKRIYMHSLPINVFSSKLINQYTSCLEKELNAFLDGKPSPFQIHKI